MTSLGKPVTSKSAFSPGQVENGATPQPPHSTSSFRAMLGETGNPPDSEAVGPPKHPDYPGCGSTGGSTGQGTRELHSPHHA